MQTMNLKAKVREKAGKQGTKDVRRRGCVPAILYGHGMQPLCLEVDAKLLSRTLHTKAGTNVLIGLEVEGVSLKESTCVIKEIQHDPVTESIQHVDFTVVSMTEKISVKVPLIVKNAEEAPGVKEGGVLEVIHHEIEVECLPANIPSSIEVDAKGMNIGDIIHASALALPQEVACKLNPDEAVVAVHLAKMEEIKPAEEEAATQPEVIEKGKKLEEGAAEEGAAAPAEKAAPKAEKK